MGKEQSIQLSRFEVFRQLKVGPITIEPKRIKVPYTLIKSNGDTASTELSYVYSEQVFDKNQSASVNLTSMMAAQVAINYGLFCQELIFDGLYDKWDQRFIVDMTENTSREIYVNKLLIPNEFLKPAFSVVKAARQKRYSNAKILFVNSAYTEITPSWNTVSTSKDDYAILSSGGKDSLLSYGLVKDLGKQAHPVFINEAGRHWFTAINAFRHLNSLDRNTSRVWCNSDRVFNWMLRQMPFIKENYADIRSDNYPIRLWTVAVFLFGVLPITLKRKTGNILIGNEYDTTRRLYHKGITHYDGLYDQSKYFDNTLTRYYLKKGWNIHQYSLLRSLSELLILKILVKRFPDLQVHQVSCHAAHEHDNRIYPCGNCEKCRRIVGMLSVLDEDPRNCGYNADKIKKALKNLESNTVKQIGADAAHLFHLLVEKNLIARNGHTNKLAKPQHQIMKLRFDRERSWLVDMPVHIREPLLRLILPYSEGSALLEHRKWTDFNILGSKLLNQPYPFELKVKGSKK